MYNLNNNQTSIIWSHIVFNKLFFKTYRFRVIGDLLKVVGWQKSPFLAKSVQKYLNKKIKTDFFQKSTFFESPIAQKRFIFEHSYVSYGKRQKSCTLLVIFVILSYLTSPIFNSSSKLTGFFF